MATQRPQHKLVFILPMWRTLKMVQAGGLAEQLAEMTDDDGKRLDIKPPPFDQVIQNQPFY